MVSPALVPLNIKDCNSCHLQNGDLPRFVLVSNLLTRDNYNSWHRSIEKELKAKNKIEFVNGAILNLLIYIFFVIYRKGETTWFCHGS